MTNMSIDLSEIRLKTGGGSAWIARCRRPTSLGLSAAVLFTLTACGVNRVLPPPVVAYDYHDRHPVVIAEAPTSIDIFPSPGSARLDSRTVSRIREFVDDYRRFGHGQITLLSPNSGPNVRSSRFGAEQVRRVLASAGLNGSVYVGTYPVGDPSLAAPLRLSFVGIKAKVAGRCGEWPADLASGSSMEGWQNTTYWNFGCSNQATLAAQVADPRDLVTPRAEDPGDIEMRMRAIGKVRTGDDPSTKWQDKAGSISSVGGN
jgi:pilus assembly protein CpaD